MPLLRRLLPWFVSALALVWVFGRSDWTGVWAALREADLGLFLFVVVVDKIVFFLAWAWFQAESIRRFAGPVATREVVALRGGSELIRSVSQSLGDAAFILGLTRLRPGHVAAVIAATGVPFACHFLVLLAQSTLSLPLFGASLLADHRDVLAAVATGWATLALAILLVRFGPAVGFGVALRVRAWIERIDWAGLRPILAGFLALGVADVVVQKLTAASFGIDLPWREVIARLPILYAALTLPSFGNFGTREAAWGVLFSEFAEPARLQACALATNATFLLLNLGIGMLFLPRAIALLAELREARRSGTRVGESLLTPPVDS